MGRKFAGEKARAFVAIVMGRGGVAVFGVHCAVPVAPPELDELLLLLLAPLPLLLELEGGNPPELLELEGGKPPLELLLLELFPEPLELLLLELFPEPLELLELLKPPEEEELLPPPPSKLGFGAALEQAPIALIAAAAHAALATRHTGKLGNFADILGSSDDGE